MTDINLDTVELKNANFEAVVDDKVIKASIQDKAAAEKAETSEGPVEALPV